MKRNLCLLMAVLLLTCSFSACAKKEENPLLMYEFLKEEGYPTSIIMGESSMYSAVYNNGIAFLIDEENIRYIINVYSEESNEHGTVQTTIIIGCFILCANNKTAKELKKELDDDNIKRIVDSVDNVVVQRKGALVFVGDEAVWKDFR